MGRPEPGIGGLFQHDWKPEREIHARIASPGGVRVISVETQDGELMTWTFPDLFLEDCDVLIEGRRP